MVPGDDGTLRGVEAVVDKDLTAALLAEAVGADALLLLTDVAAVIDGYGPAHCWTAPLARPSCQRRERREMSGPGDGSRPLVTVVQRTHTRAPPA